nr:LOB domain-containing protein 24-like [Ipomoea batatas]
MATGSRCAACRQLRRRCTSDCIFLSYFPPNDPQRFAVVHKIFGANNAGKMLKQVEEYKRGDVAESLYYEAQCRVEDPVYGCVGIVTLLQQEIYSFESQLAKIETQIQLLKAQGVAAPIL